MWRRTRREKDLDAEIKFHLTQEAKLRAERGATAEEAQLGARRAFGSVALAREATRAVWVSTAVEQLVQDLRFGCRILTKSPALSATAVILIALVIGGNTTVFSIAHGILKRPAEGVNAQGLVTLNWIDDRRQYPDPDISYRVYKNLAQHASTLRPMLAFQVFRRFTLNHENGSHSVHGMLVSGNCFEALEVRFARGRSFTGKEAETPDPALMVVISDHAWETHFQRAGDVIGRGDVERPAHSWPTAARRLPIGRAAFPGIGARQGRSRLSSALVVVQLALSVLLVTSAGLAYRSLFLIDNFDSGFDTGRVLLVTVNTAGGAGNPGANESLLELLREELRGVAGVEHVTYARNSLQALAHRGERRWIVRGTCRCRTESCWP